MSIYDLQRSKRLRALGQELGREGLALFVKEIAEQIVTTNSCREMIIFAGKIAAAVQACGFDGYWSEKAELGKQDGVWLLAQAAAKKKAVEDSKNGAQQANYATGQGVSESVPSA